VAVGQVRHALGPKALQVAQLPSHGKQAALPVVYLPDGQAARHWPSSSLGASVGQERHALEPPPLHVTQLVSQLWQLLLASA